MKSLKPIGELLKKFIANRKLKQRLNEAQAIMKWSEATGEKISENTMPVRVKDGVLFVSVKDSIWLHELNRLKPSIIENVNKSVGHKTIRDIKFFLKY
ncbi:MAG: DUF721 domain-containing protein [candidate division WOR-3 bacterium]